MEKKKLNIAIVCDPITDYTAGSFVSTLRFSEILSQRGHKVIFIAAKSPSNHDVNYYKDIKIYRFFSILLPKTEKLMYISFPAEKEIKKILEDEQINILHNTIPTPSSIISTKAAKALDIAVVTHSHAQPENVFLHLPKIIPKETLNRLYYKFMYWLYSQADAIIYPTEFARKLFPDVDRRLKTEVISNGVNLDRFKIADPAPFIDKYSLDAGKKNILFVGRFHPEKSIDTLIEAMPRILINIPDAHLILVGTGHQEDEMKKLSAKLELDKHITFCGKIDEGELVQAYNAGDIFVLPSLAELEGMVVLEAMACGKPILIADSKDSASTHFVNGNGYLFKAENPEDLADKAISMLSDDVLRKKMSEASLAKSKEYDIERSADKLEELYYSILSKSPTPFNESGQ